LIYISVTFIVFTATMFMANIDYQQSYVGAVLWVFAPQGRHNCTDYR